MIKKIICWFVAWKLVIYFFSLIAISLMPIDKESLSFIGTKIFPKANYFDWIWANYDGNHYLTIAESGYNRFNAAFFPFLPLLINLTQKIFNSDFLKTGIFVCNLSFFAALFVIYKIVLLDFKPSIARQTLFFLLIFPVSFFFGAVYTESPYLLFASLCWYFARKSNWLKAGIFGYLSGLTKFVGIALFPALLIEYLYQQKLDFKKAKDSFIKSKAFFIFLIPLAIITYSFYLQIKLGDFLVFRKAMANWEQNKLIFPLQTFWRYFKIFFLYRHFDFYYGIALMEFACTIFYLYLSIYAWKKIRISYGVFMFISLIIPICTGTLQSMPRYILQFFPAFLAIALLTKRNKIIYWGTTIVFLILNFVLVTLFTRGHFVA